MYSVSGFSFHVLCTSLVEYYFIFLDIFGSIDVVIFFFDYLSIIIGFNLDVFGAVGTAARPRLVSVLGSVGAGEEGETEQKGKQKTKRAFLRSEF